VSPRGLSRREKQEHTRSCLIKAATRVFARRGLGEASIDEVAEEAGYTKGAFYSNFKNKEELFLAMLDEKFASEIERMEAALSGEEDPREQARHAARDFAGFIFADPEWPALYFQFAAQAARDEDFRQELATRCRAMREKMVEVFRRWSADFPAPPPLPLEDLAAMTDFMASGFILERTIDPELPQELYATMMATFFLGVQAMATGWRPPEPAPAGTSRRSEPLLR
jgi:AcrR family transcriptional regulator